MTPAERQTGSSTTALHQHPQVNGLIRWGRIYNRRHVTLFLQTAVDESGRDLSGVVIHEAEKKSLDETCLRDKGWLPLSGDVGPAVKAPPLPPRPKAGKY